MSIVPLVSGGLDSTLMVALMLEEGIEQYPLFLDYGQRFAAREWSACQNVLARLGAPGPTRMDLSGYGHLIPSGLTDETLDVFEDAFLPGRNLLFLLAAAGFAYVKASSAVAIGLLAEDTRLFPDQSSEFLEAAGQTLGVAFGVRMKVMAPLMAFHKADILVLAGERGISGTYSCHSGTAEPCGRCVSCREIAAARAEA
jgi:7-cyano-7-deazaguanine synthase